MVLQLLCISVVTDNIKILGTWLMLVNKCLNNNKGHVFEDCLTVHLSIFISVINQLDAQNFCFTISVFHASTCFEHMCSKHVQYRPEINLL